MNRDQLKGKWKQIKGSVKERWGKLTDDDLDVINGQSEQLVGKIQERYGIAREAAQKQVDEWNIAAAAEDRRRSASDQAELEKNRRAS
jgi:uncharacterized protein YjbJ (UPF0337 family)